MILKKSLAKLDAPVATEGRELGHARRAAEVAGDAVAQRGEAQPAELEPPIVMAERRRASPLRGDDLVAHLQPLAEAALDADRGGGVVGQLGVDLVDELEDLRRALSADGLTAWHGLEGSARIRGS